MTMRKQAKMRQRKGKKIHPVLVNPKHRIIYNYVSRNPGVTRTEAIRACASHPQVVADLVNEGLLFEGERRNRSGTLWTVPENSKSSGRDTVEVNIEVFCNQYGEFSIKSTLIGAVENNVRGFPVRVAKKKVTIKVPRPKERGKTAEHIDFSIQPTSPQEEKSQTVKKKSLTIDGEFSIVNK